MSAQAIATLTTGDPDINSWYGNTTTSGCVQSCYPYTYWPYQDRVVYHYDLAQTVVEDKTKKAFALAKTLIKSKFMHASKIEDFIELVEVIEKGL